MALTTSRAALSNDALQAIDKLVTAKQSDANPVVNEGGRVFLRHDELRVLQAKPGQIAVQYLWRGKLTHTMVIDGDLSAGETLTINGIEGRMTVDISR
jgi:hypothetical protein